MKSAQHECQHEDSGACIQCRTMLSDKTRIRVMNPSRESSGALFDSVSRLEFVPSTLNNEITEAFVGNLKLHHRVR